MLMECSSVHSSCRWGWTPGYVQPSCNLLIQVPSGSPRKILGATSGHYSGGGGVTNGCRPRARVERLAW